MSASPAPAQGADAAVTLLRRYYLDFGRKSALDIVRRWAPAECRGGPSLSLSVLAVRGMDNAAGALARGPARDRKARACPGRCGGQEGGERQGGGAACHRPACVGRSAAPASSFRVPNIAVGLGERRATTVCRARACARRRQPTPASVAAATRAKDARAAPVELARAKAIAPVAPVRVASAAPAASCTPDEGRIRNYAARMVQGLDLGPGDDLKLFASDGTPMPNLPRVMLAMCWAVELGVVEGQHGADRGGDRPRPRRGSRGARRSMVRAGAAAP